MRLLLVTLALLLLSPLAFSQQLTAAGALHQIQQRYPAHLPSDTVDTIKAGDPATPVTGIAVTFLDTMDVLRAAAASHLNLVITHEPTFYNHRDQTTFFANDPVYQEKLAFLQQHNMVVFRLHDAIHDVPPDHIALGLIKRLGWQQDAAPDDPFLVTLPQITLQALVAQLQQKLSDPTIRAVGDPHLRITHAALLPGASGLEKQVLALRRPDVDVLIAGEASEWETVEYVRDAVAQGRHKALILLGHQPSEEPGMEQCTQDLKTLFPALKVEHIAAQNPFLPQDAPPPQ